MNIKAILERFVSLEKRTGAVPLVMPFRSSYSIQQPSTEVIAQMTAANLAAKGLQGGAGAPDVGIDPQPKDSDYIYPLFRALDAGLIEGYWIDFSDQAVLKAAVPLLEGQTIYTMHGKRSGPWGMREIDINDWIGSINQSIWDDKGDKAGGVPGINTELKVDWTIDPKLARGLLMKPPAVHAVSVTPVFSWEPSHQDLIDQGRFFQLLGETVDDQIVRLVVTEIHKFCELSFVPEGANPGSNGGPIEPDQTDEELSAIRSRLSEVLRDEFHRDYSFSSSLVEELAASGATDWPLSDRGTSWDSSAAETNLRKWASHDGSGTKEKMDWKKYNRVFFWHESTKALNFTSYKLPFCDVVNGKVVAVWAAVTAAAAAIQGSRGGVKIPDGDVAGVKTRIEKYYAKARKQYGDSKIQVPWKNQSTQSNQSADDADSDKEKTKVKLTPEQKKALGLEAQTGDEFEDSVVLSAVDSLTVRTVSAEAKAQAAQSVIDAERAEVVRLATISEGITGDDKQVKLPDVLSEMISKADASQLPGLKTLYKERVDAKFAPKCARCGSTEVSRRSSVEEGSQVQDDKAPALRQSSTF